MVIQHRLLQFKTSFLIYYFGICITKLWRVSLFTEKGFHKFLQCNVEAAVFWINVSITNPTMHLSYPQCTIQNRNVHVFVLNGILWDMRRVHCVILWDWPILVCSHAVRISCEWIHSPYLTLTNPTIHQTNIPAISHKTPFWNRYEHTCRGYPAKRALPAMLTHGRWGPFWQDTLDVHIAVRRTWLRAESVVSTGLRSTQYTSLICLVFDRSLDGLVCVRYVFSARLVLFIEGRFLFVGKLHEMTSTGTLIYGWWRAWAFMTSTGA